MENVLNGSEVKYYALDWYRAEILETKILNVIKVIFYAYGRWPIDLNGIFHPKHFKLLYDMD